MRDHIILNADIPMMSPTHELERSTTVPNLVEGTTQQPGHMLIQEFKMERPPEGANSSECCGLPREGLHPQHGASLCMQLQGYLPGKVNWFT